MGGTEVLFVTAGDMSRLKGRCRGEGPLVVLRYGAGSIGYRGPRGWRGSLRGGFRKGCSFGFRLGVSWLNGAKNGHPRGGVG